MDKALKRKLSTLILAVAILCAGFSLSLDTYAAGKTHYIAVGSDRHDTPKAIGIAMSGMPDSVEYVCLNGDMVNAAGSSDRNPGGPPPGAPGGGRSRKQSPYNTSTILKEVQSIFPKLNASNISVVYGSHDANATDDAGIMKNADKSLLPSTTGDDQDNISKGQSGLIYTGYDGSEVAYYIYGVSYYDMIKPNDDGSGGDGGKKSAEAFREFAKQHPDIPLIVIGHVPIHALRGDNLAASYWNDALNEAATGSSDGSRVIRDVVYLHGHNHTVEKTEYYIKPGEKMNVQGTTRSESKLSDIYYTYITAGYLRDNHTATLISVRDHSLSFKKYKGCVVSFDERSGSEVEDAVVQQSNKISCPPDPVRSGYVFLGWFKDAACENAWNFGKDKVTDDMTLYASWIRGAKPGTT